MLRPAFVQCPPIHPQAPIAHAQRIIIPGERLPCVPRRAANRSNFPAWSERVCKRQFEIACTYRRYRQPPAAHLIPRCPKLDRCWFALAVSILLGLEARSRLDNPVPSFSDTLKRNPAKELRY